MRGTWKECENDSVSLLRAKETNVQDGITS